MEPLPDEKDLWIELDKDNSTDADLIANARKAFFKIFMHCDDENVRFIEANADKNSVLALKKLEERHEGEGALSKTQILNDCHDEIF